jgi:TetR/AcrR family transcriptional regulator, regulator of mycofactocin system
MIDPDSPLEPQGAAPARRGRPPRTTASEVARIALELFLRDGFTETTLDDIARAAGIGRRTLFRYFDSKNDMVWGDFDWVLDRLRCALSESVPGETVMDTLARAVIESNHYEAADLEELRLRMTLITTVPALQAHSMVMYAAWRSVIAEFVSERTGQMPDDLLPLTVGHMALASSMSAFVRWVEHPEEDLEDHLRVVYTHLSSAFPGL